MLDGDVSAVELTKERYSGHCSSRAWRCRGLDSSHTYAKESLPAGVGCGRGGDALALIRFALGAPRLTPRNSQDGWDLCIPPYLWIRPLNMGVQRGLGLAAWAGLERSGYVLATATVPCTLIQLILEGLPLV